MEYHSSKRKELSEQLTSWWHTQTDFKTKKSLADFLKVHPDTLGDYFSGRKFPRLDIANRLCELTKIACLKSNAGAGSFSGTVPQEASPAPPSPRGVAASTEKSQEPDVTHLMGQGTYRSGVIPEVQARQVPKEFSGEQQRHKERAVIISLERTSCPFCAHNIAQFRSCTYCGQHFVWANVPVEDDELV